MRLLPATLLRLDHVQEMLGLGSRTAAVGRSAEIAEVIIKAAGKKGQLILEHEDGTRERLIIPGT